MLILAIVCLATCCTVAFAVWHRSRKSQEDTPLDLGKISSQIERNAVLPMREQEHLLDVHTPHRSTQRRTRSSPTARKATPAGSIHELLPKVFIILDLETTGLSPSQHEIIEIGAIRVTLQETEHETFQTFVRPLSSISKRITSLTGITQAMIDADGIHLTEAMSQLAAFIGDAPIVTYNASFDMPFVWRAASTCGLTLRNRYTCALKSARRAYPELDSHRLAHVSSVMNLPSGDQHRALGDCVRTLHVFCSSTATLGKKVKWSSCPQD